MEMQMQRAESGYNPYAYTATSAYVAGNGGAMMPMINDINARLNNHEIVLNRHEEVVNRHEEVVNRHEQVVNDDWAWLKSLEARMQEVEWRTKPLHRRIVDFMRRVKRKLFH